MGHRFVAFKYITLLISSPDATLQCFRTTSMQIRILLGFKYITFLMSSFDAPLQCFRATYM